MRNMHMPTSPIAIRSFMKLASLYRRFYGGFNLFLPIDKVGTEDS